MTENPIKKIEISGASGLEEENRNLKLERDNALKAAQDSKKALEALRRKRETKPVVPRANVSFVNPEGHPNASTVEKETSSPPPPGDPGTGHGHEEGKPHFIGAWQKHCPTCGDKNPDFKDETKCDDCGMHLGAKEVAEKLKACPNCGGHHASKL